MPAPYVQFSYALECESRVTEEICSWHGNTAALQNITTNASGQSQARRQLSNVSWSRHVSNGLQPRRRWPSTCMACDHSEKRLAWQAESALRGIDRYMCLRKLRKISQSGKVSIPREAHDIEVWWVGSTFDDLGQGQETP